MLPSFDISLALSLIFISATSTLICSPALLDKPNLTGASIQSSRDTISFCNATVTHTHPGHNDTVHTQVLLPLKGWNGRFQALGGGGYSTGFGSLYLTHSVANGFASASTDGGFPSAHGKDAIPTDLAWAPNSEGVINWNILNNYASTETNEMALVGQQIIRSYHRKSPRYSYFPECSGGGR